MEMKTALTVAQDRYEETSAANGNETALTVAQDRYEETKVFVAHSTASENRRLKWK